MNQQQLDHYVTGHRRHFEDLLAQMVEIPSISMDPTRTGDIRRMANLAVQVLTDLGAKAKIVETGGYPIVSGGWTTGTNHPTVAIYNHLDVQPAQEPEWKQEPFAFRNEGGLYRGRGATDDKGPALAAARRGGRGHGMRLVGARRRNRQPALFSGIAESCAD